MIFNTMFVLHGCYYRPQRSWRKVMFLSRGVSVRETPPYGNERAVSILLDAFLFFKLFCTWMGWEIISLFQTFLSARSSPLICMLHVHFYSINSCIKFLFTGGCYFQIRWCSNIEAFRWVFESLKFLFIKVKINLKDIKWSLVYTNVGNENMICK